MIHRKKSLAVLLGRGAPNCQTRPVATRDENARPVGYHQKSSCQPPPHKTPPKIRKSEKERRNEKRNWDAMYAKLKQFHEAHGHSNVPQRFPTDRSLGTWVSRLRGQRVRRKLSPNQIDRLNALDFDWEIQSERFDRIWLEKFQLLQRFRATHGHCNVPTFYKQDECCLGFWVVNQRMLYKRQIMRPERVQKLESIGFQWIADQRMVWDDTRDTNVTDVLWWTMYQQLVDYYNDYGHVVVPNLFIEGKNWPLGRWVRAQRTNCTQNTLLEERRRQLDELGFVWTVVACNHPSQEHAVARHRWDDLLERLLEYRRQNGDCLVPETYEPDVELGCWVQELRRRLKDGSIHPHRIEVLDAIGFMMPRNKFQAYWKQQYRNLVAYKTKYGSTRIKHVDEGRLFKWVSAQRLLRKHNLLSECQRQKLDALGFDWSKPAKTKDLLDPCEGDSSFEDNSPCDSDNETKANSGDELSQSLLDESLGDRLDDSSIKEPPRERVKCSYLFPAGTSVKKFFPGHGWFKGRIIAFEGIYLLRYDDGDEEEMLFGDPILDDLVVGLGQPLASDCFYQPGTRIKKHFPGYGWYAGEIHAFDGVYLVRYEDGDEEEFYFDSPELLSIIQPSFCDQQRPCQVSLARGYLDTETQGA